MIGPKLFITCVISLCIGNNILSQTEQPLLTNLTTNEGLSFNTVRAIHQDEQGYMYFQTWKGLDRYDGIEFQNFRCTSERYQETGFSIAEDSLGNLWYSAVLSRYSKTEGSSQLFTVLVQGEQMRIGGVMNIQLGPDHLLYLTSSNNLLTLNPYQAELSINCPSDLPEYS
jgi:ligand-binding sensor domain-containing protein